MAKGNKKAKISMRKKEQAKRITTKEEIKTKKRAKI